MTPVKKQLKKYIASCSANDEYQRQLESLSRVVSSPEWKIAVGLLWNIKNEMAVELLQSKKYTEDSSESKDVTQKVYHNIAEWIDFLTNPRIWVQKKCKIQILTNKLKGQKPERKEP